MRLRFLVLALATIVPQASQAVDRPTDRTTTQNSSQPAQSYRLAAGSCMRAERSYPPGHVARLCASYPPGGGACQQYQCTTCGADGRWSNFLPC
ncbi:hypothetical protein [Inquilinus sp. CA228]|uniref:hypothetical protein n=1 Tax=Inquilinus sp. CA228 TaxID=3455609 RepID=UPI003F8D23F6